MERLELLAVNLLGFVVFLATLAIVGAVVAHEFF